MGKATGLIGNFRGKVGNMVGYNLKDSNNNQTQGVRVYQPIVKNPKTHAQAEQRAKLSPINATYRWLKPIIDRGQEGKAYGNKSRLAWLKQALTYDTFPGYKKGEVVLSPVLCNITKGSLPFGDAVYFNGNQVAIESVRLATLTNPNWGAVSTALIQTNIGIEDGDQLTFVKLGRTDGIMTYKYESVIVDSQSTDAIPDFLNVSDECLQTAWGIGTGSGSLPWGTVILSRQGANGQWLRSTAKLLTAPDKTYDHVSAEDWEEAVQSYMAGGVSSDWAEEAIQ